MHVSYYNSNPDVTAIDIIVGGSTSNKKVDMTTSHIANTMNTKATSTIIEPGKMKSIKVNNSMVGKHIIVTSRDTENKIVKLRYSKDIKKGTAGVISSSTIFSEIYSTETEIGGKLINKVFYKEPIIPVCYKEAGYTNIRLFLIDRIENEKSLSIVEEMDGVYESVYKFEKYFVTLTTDNLDMHQLLMADLPQQNRIKAVKHSISSDNVIFTYELLNTTGKISIKHTYNGSSNVSQFIDIDTKVGCAVIQSLVGGLHTAEVCLHDYENNVIDSKMITFAIE